MRVHISQIQFWMSCEDKGILTTFPACSNNQKEYTQVESADHSLARLLNAISDEKSLSLFKTIAVVSDSTLNGQQYSDGTRISITHLDLTRKQYYHRLSRLRSLGLIYRKKARYSLSSLGRILYVTQKTIEQAVQNRWKLVAIDSLETYLTPQGLPNEERIKFIDTVLRDNDEIKKILLPDTKIEKQDAT